MFSSIIQDRIQFHQEALELLEEMYEAAQEYDQNFENSEFMENGGVGRMSSGSSNRGDQENFNSSRSGGRGNQGRANFADSNDETDGRTRAGRDQDDEEFSDRELRGFLRNKPQEAMKEDGEAFDLRTKIGRALEAAGLVDDEGFPINTRSGGGSR